MSAKRTLTIHPRPKAKVGKPKPAAKGKVKASAKSERKPRRPSTPRTVYDIKTRYAGESKGLNARKSVTALEKSIFGSKPDYVLTERTETVAAALKTEFGGKTFKRGNIDAGILKYLAMKGHIEYVDGDLASEDAELKFTAAGLRYTAAAKNKKAAKAKAA